MEVGSFGLVPACLLVDTRNHFIFNKSGAMVTVTPTAPLVLQEDQGAFINEAVCYLFGFLSRGP